jgi:uncharacterized SAM-binding protein YcdF (DUF218 family)
MHALHGGKRISFMYFQPLYPLVLLLVFLGLVRFWRKSQGQKPVFLALAFLGLFLVSWPPFAWLALQPFERPFPHAINLSNDAQAIVVLASGIQYPTVPELPVARLGSDTFERCQYAAYLHNHWRPLPVLVSGKGSQPDARTPPYAILMKEALEKEGVPQAMIWSEVQSHSTHENAQYSAEMLRKKGITRIVLVTDAYHMLRAEKCFRKQGLEVIPAACAYRSVGMLHLSNLIPSWEPVGFNEDLLHEVLGLMWYKIHGWI